jgi:hypothetical protein
MRRLILKFWDWGLGSLLFLSLGCGTKKPFYIEPYNHLYYPSLANNPNWYKFDPNGRFLHQTRFKRSAGSYRKENNFLILTSDTLTEKLGFKITSSKIPFKNDIHNVILYFDCWQRYSSGYNNYEVEINDSIWSPIHRRDTLYLTMLPGKYKLRIFGNNPQRLNTRPVPISTGYDSIEVSEQKPYQTITFCLETDLEKYWSFENDTIIQISRNEYLFDAYTPGEKYKFVKNNKYNRKRLRFKRFLGIP